MQEFFSQSLNRKNLIRGYLFFVLCTILGLSVSFLWSGTENIGRVLYSINGKLLLLATLCMIADWLCGAGRFHVFARKMSPQVTYLDSIRANLATLCVGGITQFQTGGVRHINIFNRVGVPVSGGVTSGIISFIGTLTFLILSTGYVVWRAPDSLPKGITFVSQYSLLMFLVVLLFFLLLAIKPDVLLIFLNRIRLPRGRRFRPIAKGLDRLLHTLEKLILGHKAFTRMFITDHKMVCVLSFVLTGGIYMSRFVGGYVVVRALGGHALFWHVVAAQVILNFATLFAPSPGASGIAEFLSIVLMRNLLAPVAIGLYALLTRFFTTYCGVGLGGLVLVSQLAQDLKGDN